MEADLWQSWDFGPVIFHTQSLPDDGNHGGLNAVQIPRDFAKKGRQNIVWAAFNNITSCLSGRLRLNRPP
jgi:hypothetical protein